MYARAATAYQRVDLESAPKPQILDRLLGRMLTDVESARAAIAIRDIKAKAAAIDHATQIAVELRAALDYAAAPELCGNLAALYDYVIERLALANMQLDPRRLDEAAGVVTSLRDAFAKAASAQPR
jgi:flagellar secretion chaperone FliS